MTRQDIIRMADKAKFGIVRGDGWPDEQLIHKLERFAALVASAEREACAKIVESDPSYDWRKFACEAANAIRARGQA